MGRLRIWAALALATALAASAGLAAAEPLKLEAVAILMRHGVRPPTKAQPLPVGVASDPWPSWPVEPGFLTPHGAEAVTRLGAYDRAAYAGRGLLPAKACPKAGTVEVWADTDQRTVRSAEAWANGLAPGCGLKVGRVAGDTDPLFSPLEIEGSSFDSARADDEIKARLGAGGLAAMADKQAARLQLLNRVLGCCARPVCPEPAKVCALTALPSAIVATKKGRPKLTGPLDLGATASEILMLEYTEGKPMAEVGWGRVTRDQIEDLLALHPAQYEVLIRPAYIGTLNALPLARRMLAAIEAGPKSGPRITLLLGHDTNIASLGSMLDLHWKVDSFPADDPPPGGQMGFERLSDAAGRAYVRVFYESQSMDQIRALDRLTPEHPPFRQALTLPTCHEGPEGTCPLVHFRELVTASAH